MKILVVVLSLDREPWRSLEKAQRETWAREGEGIEFVYLQGVAKGLPRAAFLFARRILERIGKRHYLDRLAGIIGSLLPVRFEDRIVRTGALEYWIGTSSKTRTGLRYIVKNMEFDYLLRTNSSTYIHLPALVAHLEQAQPEGYYAGAYYAGTDIEQVTHAQGTCVIFSRDAVKKITEDNEWDYHLVDDVAMGRAAKRAGFELNPLPQYVVTSRELAEQVSDASVSGGFIFRLKSRNRRDADIETMHVLHERMMGAWPSMG